MNDDEFEKLNGDVNKCGLSREAYLRKLVFGAEVKELPTKDFTKIIYELSMLGNNIKQIAIKAHKLNFIDTPLLNKTCEQIQLTLSKIIERIY